MSTFRRCRQSQIRARTCPRGQLAVQGRPANAAQAIRELGDREGDHPAIAPMLQRPPAQAFPASHEHRSPSALTVSSPSRSAPTPQIACSAGASCCHPFHLWLCRRELLLAAAPSWQICSTGSAKAPVLPLPVSAAAITSPPPRINGTASCCTGVGSSQPQSSSTARMIAGHSPSSANAAMQSGVFGSAESVTHTNLQLGAVSPT